MGKYDKDVAPEDNEFLKKFQGDIKDESSFREKTAFVAGGLEGKKAGPIAKIWDKVQALWRYVTSDSVPWHKKVLPLAGLVYLVSPIDLIPDVIPVLGLVDDAGVLGFIFVQMGSMLAAFGVASAVVFLAKLTSRIVQDWIATVRTSYPDVTHIELIRERMRQGNIPVIAVGLDDDEEEVVSQKWETPELDEEMEDLFDGEDRVTLELSA